MNGFMGERPGVAAMAAAALVALTALLGTAASAGAESRISYPDAPYSTSDGTVPVRWATEQTDVGYRCAVSFDPADPWDVPDPPAFADSDTCTEPWSFEVEEPGKRTVRIWLVDATGHEVDSWGTVIAVYFDPQAEISGTPLQNAISNAPHTDFSITAANAEQLVQFRSVCRLDGGQVPELGPFAFSGRSFELDRSPCFSSDESINTVELPDGLHTLEVQGMQPMGSGAFATAGFGEWVSRTWTKDTHAPDTVLTGGLDDRVEVDPGTRADVGYSISGSDPAPGTGIHFECRLDGGAWNACGPAEQRSLAVGEHEFAARAVDAAGNADPTPVVQRVKVVDRAACARASARAGRAAARVARVRDRLRRARRHGHRRPAARLKRTLKHARASARDARMAAADAC